MGIAVDIRFCQHYRGDGTPPSNRFCRTCPHAALACDALWQRVVDISASGGVEGLPLEGTRARILPNPRTWNIVHLSINCRWDLPKEDFLHFIATGHAQMGRAGDRRNVLSSPSMTRQEPYVQAIVRMLGGWDIPAIEAVRRIQRGMTE